MEGVRDEITYHDMLEIFGSSIVHLLCTVVCEWLELSSSPDGSGYFPVNTVRMWYRRGLYVDKGIQFVGILTVVLFLLTLYHQCPDGGSTL